MTHLNFSKLIKLIGYCSQIDAGNVFHLRETREKQWLTIPCFTQIHLMMANLHKEVWKPNLRCDGSEVHVFQFVSKTLKLFFIFRAQDRDGGQSDVCFIKVILDLLCILCVTIREGGGRENIAANEAWVNEDKQFQHMFNGHEDMLGLNGRTLTLDTFSSSSRFTISCRWNVVHRGWFSLQSL